MTSGRQRPALLWDWDGTIADTVPHMVSAHHAATEAVMGFRLDEEAIRGRIGEPARRRIGALVGPEHAHEVFRLYSARIQSIAPRDTPLFSDVLHLIVEASADAVANVIVTSRPVQQVVSVLDHFDLRSYFQGVVGLEDTNRHKPSAEPLLRGAQLAKAEPDVCVYIGDAVVDMRAASAAAIAGIAVTWGAGTAAALASAHPWRLVASVPELYEAVAARVTQQMESGTS